MKKEERRKKNEERRKKNEERRKKNEERRKKKEERRKKEERGDRNGSPTSLHAYELKDKRVRGNRSLRLLSN